MNHNFSRELAFFNLAQQIIQDLELEELNSLVAAISIDKATVNKACTKYLGREMIKGEWKTIQAVLNELAPILPADCSTFEFAHAMFHLIED